MRNLLHLAIMCILFHGATGLAQERVPKFTDYPARIIPTRRFVKLQLHSTPDTACFRTMLRRVARLGLRFAGHYAVGSWGCGTCLRLGIVDLTTGRTYVTPFEASSRRASLNVQTDSRLLVIDDAEHPPGEYYLWTGRHLLPIYNGKVERQEPERQFLRCSEMARFR